MESTTVVNLATGEEREYSLPPADAVMAAYAQERGDWNTWAYEQYRPLVTFGHYTALCGDWSALLPRKS